MPQRKLTLQQHKLPGRKISLRRSLAGLCCSKRRDFAAKRVETAERDRSVAAGERHSRRRRETLFARRRTGYDGPAPESARLSLRGAFGSAWRGKSELQRVACSLTARRGDATDSATEKIPPPSFGPAVRVKWCGKSAPLRRRRRRTGKTPCGARPNRGTVRGRPVPPSGPSGSGASSRVGCWRPAATPVAEE